MNDEILIERKILQGVLLGGCHLLPGGNIMTVLVLDGVRLSQYQLDILFCVETSRFGTKKCLVDDTSPTTS
jgi:hypothetical protein